MNPIPSSFGRKKPTFHPPAVWDAIQSDYILGLGSTRALAKKYGIPVHTLQVRCRRGDWVQLRAERQQQALDDLILGDHGQPAASILRQS